MPCSLLSKAESLSPHPLQRLRHGSPHARLFMRSWSPASTWTAAITGHSVVTTVSLSDELADPAEFELVVALARFVVADGNRTGAFISLGSLFSAITEPTEVPFLPGGVVVAPLEASGLCLEAIRRVGKHSSLDHLTDGTLLAVARCNVTATFVSWPSTLSVLAVTNSSATGHAIILAYGISVSFNVSLSVNSSNVMVGDQVTLIATVLVDDVLLAGARVLFRVVSGLGHTLPPVVATDTYGHAQLTVSSLAVGESVFETSVELAEGRVQVSNRVTVKWSTVPVVMLRRLFLPLHAHVWTAVQKEIVLKSDAEWNAMTTADFASYSAVVLPDQNCLDDGNKAFLNINGL